MFQLKTGEKQQQRSTRVYRSEKNTLILWNYTTLNYVIHLILAASYLLR